MVDVNELKNSDNFTILITLLVSSLAFIISLAWNDAIQSVIAKYIDNGDTRGKIIYAVLITIATVLIVKNINF